MLLPDALAWVIAGAVVAIVVIVVLCRLLGKKTTPEHRGLDRATDRTENDDVERLIGVGARTVAEQDGFSPLHHAAWKGRHGVVERLVIEGADVTATDNDGVTALHYAANAGHKDVVEVLVAHGADVNAKDPDGNTPLRLANAQCNFGVAFLLKQHGARE